MDDFGPPWRAYRRRTAAPLLLLAAPPSPGTTGGPGCSRGSTTGWPRSPTPPGVHAVWAEEHPYEVHHDPATDELGHMPYPPVYFAALAAIAVRRLPTPEAEPERAATPPSSSPTPPRSPSGSRRGRPAVAGQQLVEPETPTEQRLAVLWRDVLGVEQVGANTDFFGLGGHSLLATHLLSRLRREFGREVSLYTLFTNPTVAALAAVLDADRRRRPPPLLPARAGPPVRGVVGAAPALGDQPARRRRRPAQHMPPRTLRGDLDEAALRRALPTIVLARHEVLRTTFTGTGAVSPSRWCGRTWTRGWRRWT